MESLGVQWASAPDQPAFDGGTVAAVAAGGPGFVAVGDVGGAAASWASRDGLIWQRSADDPALDGAWMSAVTGAGQGLVAVGVVPGSRAAAWTSADGLTWRRADETPDLAGGWMRGVVAGPSGLVAVGGMWGASGRPITWTSSDGTRWTRAPDDPSLVGARLSGVVASGLGVVAFGCRWANDTCAEAAIWASVDGLHWRGGSEPGRQGLSGLVVRSVVRTASGYVALGDDGPATAAWTSTDGLIWTPTGDDAVASCPSLGVASAGGVIAVTAYRQGSDPWRARACASTDGRRWTALPSGATLGGEVVGLAADPARIVAVLRTADGRPGAAVSPTVSSIPPVPSATPPVPEPTPGAALGWQAADVGGPARAVIDAVAAGGPGFVAVGCETGPLYGECVRATAWTSTDGRSWGAGRHISAANGGSATSIVVGGGLIVAAGHTLAGAVFRAAAWTSRDGRTWTRTSDDASFSGRVIVGLAPGGPGFVAVGPNAPVGSEYHGMNVWTSPDGRRWTPVSDVPQPGVIDGVVSGAAGSSGVRALVAWGATCVDCVGSRPALFVSSDGTDWMGVPDQPAFDGATIGEIVASGDGFLAVGQRQTAAGTVAATWTSPDGRAWTRGPEIPGPTGTSMSDVAVTDTGFVATGTVAGEMMDTTLAWSSTDGRRWSLRTLPDHLFGALVGDLVGDGTGVVAVGWTWPGSTPDTDVGSTGAAPAAWSGR